METVGTVDQAQCFQKRSYIFYSLNTFIAPSTLYQFNLSTKLYTIFSIELSYNPSDYETKPGFFNSKDGTKSSDVYYLQKGNCIKW